MIHFERSFDYELIRRILTHERIWPHYADSAYFPVSGDRIPQSMEMVAGIS
jgi:hypothetical protein